jgi:hypothetical protein
MERLVGPSYLFMNATMSLMALATLWLVYRSISEMASPWWGLIVAAVTGLLHVTLEYSAYLMTDIPAMFGFWLGFYFLQRLARRPGLDWRDVLGAGVGLAFGSACRYTTAFFLPLFALVPWLRPRDQWFRRRKNLLLAAVIALPTMLVTLGWLLATTLTAKEIVAEAPTLIQARDQIALYIWWGDFLGTLELRRLWFVIVVFVNATFKGLTTFGIEAIRMSDPDYLNPTRVTVLATGFLFMCTMMALGGKRVWRNDRGLSVLAVCVYAGAMILWQRLAVQRYLLPVLPFLVWFLAEGLNAVWEKLRRVQPAAGATMQGFPLRWPAVACLAGLLLPNLTNIAAEIRQAHRSDYYATCDNGMWKDFWEASRWIREHAPREARLFTRESQLMHFWTKRPCLRRLELTRAGDLLVLERMGDPRLRFNRWALEQLDWELLEAKKAWSLVDSGAARELHRTGNVSVYLREPSDSIQSRASQSTRERSP